jgi:hypothetical protein
VDRARPHLENLNRSLIEAIPLGKPEEYQQQRRQHEAIFAQRLNDLLRDIETEYSEPGEPSSLQPSLEPTASTAPSTVEASLGSTSVSGSSLTPTITPDTAGEAHPFLRFAESFEPLSPRPVPKVMTVALQGAPSSSASSTVSTELNVDLAEPVGSRGTQVAVMMERRLAEHPKEIRDEARDLARAIADQINLINARKPNEKEQLAKHNNFTAFLQEIVERIDALAE